MVESSEQPEAQPEAEEHPQVALINKVLDKIEEFYFEDGPESGEKLFAEFADRHHTTFEDDVDVEGIEHKLE